MLTGRLTYTWEGGCLQVGEHVSGSLRYYIADLLGTDGVFSGDPFGVEPDLLLLQKREAINLLT